MWEPEAWSRFLGGRGCSHTVIAGYFRYGLDTRVLDAHMRFNLTVQQPEFSVPLGDQLDVYLPFGMTEAKCLNPGMGQPEMLLFHFHNGAMCMLL